MTRSLVFKYIRIDSNGTRKYRRRVPKELQSVLGKQEFFKVLRKTELEAMRNYPVSRDQTERSDNRKRQIED